MKDLDEAIRAIRAFRDDRDWAQFHTVRNLAAALSIEAAELQEALLWKTDGEVLDYLESDVGHETVRREIADVLIYALLFCHEASIDPLDAIHQKLEHNNEKYPAELARGRADKYTNLK